MIGIKKNDQAFSGIEAAIVLIAFIAVAVIFGYVLMGLGQNASQEAKNQALAGIDTIMFAPDGVKGLDTSGNGDSIDVIEFWMYGGNSKIDMTKITMDFMSPDRTYMVNPASPDWNGIYKEGKTPTEGQWLVTSYLGDGDTLLEKGERMQIAVGLDGEGGIAPNEEFTLKIMTAEGITHTLSGKAPAYIDPVNQLSIV